MESLVQWQIFAPWSWKGSSMHLRRLPTRVSLYNLHRLTWAEVFRSWLSFSICPLISLPHQESWFRWLLTLYLTCQFWALPIQQQMKICHKYWQMGIQVSAWVENVGKEEIARYEQILLFPQVFKNCLLLMHWNEYLWSKGLIKGLKIVPP